MPSKPSQARKLAAAPWAGLLAALVALAVLTAACSPDPPDALPPDGSADSAQEAQPEDSDGSGSTTDDGEAYGDTPQADDGSEPGEAAGSDGEVASDRGETAGSDAPEPDDGAADLGTYSDYAPGAADPTPLPTDPQVVVGQLANGFTYYLRSNDSPGGTAVARLVVAAGAGADPVGAEGTAHFLEHLLLRGTARFSGDELAEALRSLGTGADPHANSSTHADATVYTLEASLDDPDSLDLALAVLAEWASAAAIAAEDVTAVRGVLLDEVRRHGETASGRLAGFFDEIYFRGSAYEGMTLEGSEASIRSITDDQLREFYDTHYRPDNMALVIVGDLPVSQIEPLVQQHFADIEARSAAAPAADRDPAAAAPADEPVVDIVTDPEHDRAYVSLDWRLPSWPSGNVGGERLLVMEQLIALMVESRLAAAHEAGLMAQASRPFFSEFAPARGVRLWGTSFAGPDLGQAVTDVVSVMQGAAHFGFGAVEAGPAVSRMRASLEFESSNDQTLGHDAHATRLADHFLAGADISPAAERAARRSALLDAYTAEELTAHLRWLLDTAPPLVVAIGADPSAVPATAQLRAAVAAAAPLAPPPAEVSIAELMARPSPAAPVREDTLGLYDGAHEWEFANGARVVFVPSDAAAGEVDLTAQSLGGWSALTAGDSALVNHAIEAVVASGIGDASGALVEEYLESTTAHAQPFIAEFTEGFSGASRSHDIESLFALIHLYYTQPGVTAEAASDEAKSMRALLALSRTQPQWKAELALLDALYRGSPWHRFVAAEDQIDATTAESLLAMYRARLSTVDDLLVVVVGATNRETVSELAAHWIGTLPGGAADTFTNRRRPMRTGTRRITTPVNAITGTTGFDIVFGVEAAIDTRRLVTADIATALLDRHLTARLLSHPDAHVASVAVTPEPAPKSWQARITYVGGSDGLDAAYADVINIVTELAIVGPSQRDFSEAVAAVDSRYAAPTNASIAAPLLLGHVLDRQDLGTPAQRREALSRVTAADVQTFIAALFNLQNRLESFRIVEEE